MSATRMSSAKTVGDTVYPFETNDKAELPFSLPPIVFTPAKPLKEAAFDQIANKFAACGAQKETAGSSFTVSFIKPSYEAVRALAPMQDRGTSPSIVTTPLEVSTAVKLWEMIETFLRVQTYDAKEVTKSRTVQDENDEEMEETYTEVETYTFNMGLAAGEQVTLAIKYQFSEAEKEKDDRMEEIMAYFEKNGKMMKDGSKEMIEGYQAIRSRLLDEGIPAMVSVPTVPVFKAKPSPFSVSINMGDVSSVPSSPGFVFPFFDGMIIPDKRSLPRLFASTGFAPLLATEHDDLLTNFSDFMKDLMNLSSSPLGAMLGHIMTGVNLSLDTQARLFVIIQDGEYLGFALLGQFFSLIFDGMERRPQTVDEFAKSIAALSSHASSLQTICDMLSLVRLKGSQEHEMVVPKDISSGGSKKLVEELKRREKPSGDDLKELTKLFRRLRFNEAYLPSTMEAVRKALFAVAFEEISEYALRPHYLDPNFDYTNPSVLVFTAFGPEFVSPVNSKGTEFEVGKVKPMTPKEIEDVVEERKEAAKRRAAKGNKRPRDEEPEISVSKADAIRDPKASEHANFIALPRKPISLALKDWEEFRKTHVLKMDLKERSASHRCLVEKGTRSKVVSFWKAISMYGWSSSNQSAEVSKKNKKVEVSATDFMQSLGLEYDEEEEVVQQPPAKKAKKDKKGKGKAKAIDSDEAEEMEED